MGFLGIRVLLVDNDMDDCLLFSEALQELAFDGDLTTLHDGEQLMRFLVANKQFLPHMLFLDLNMPRKNGFECLSEIMMDNDLKQLPVIIYSTSFQPEVVKTLHEKGASYFIRKPAVFSDLKSVILRSLTLVSDDKHPTLENFVIHSK